jgi:hypothetical protein
MSSSALRRGKPITFRISLRANQPVPNPNAVFANRLNTRLGRAASVHARKVDVARLSSIRKNRGAVPGRAETVPDRRSAERDAAGSAKAVEVVGPLTFDAFGHALGIDDRRRR